MKSPTFSRQATVALLVFFTCGISLASVSEGAKKRGYATEIDFTDETKNSIDAVSGVQTLRVFEKDFKHDSYIYGAYGQPLAGTGGTTIELFPNGKFAVTEWCDICGLPATLYFGTWHEQDGLVTFDVEQQKHRGCNASSIDAILAGRSQHSQFPVYRRSPIRTG